MENGFDLQALAFVCLLVPATFGISNYSYVSGNNSEAEYGGSSAIERSIEDYDEVIEPMYEYGKTIECQTEECVEVSEPTTVKYVEVSEPTYEQEETIECPTVECVEVSEPTYEHNETTEYSIEDYAEVIEQIYEAQVQEIPQKQFVKSH